jgi:hypothetical protein
MFKRIFNRLFPNSYVQHKEISKVKAEQESTKFLLGQMLAKSLMNNDFKSSEFKVFSQWGEDGIIQFLINNIQINQKSFIEFGVENYRESNTRFLLMNNNWKGLLIDGSHAHVEDIKNQDIYWKYDITAVATFITKENINTIFKSNHFIEEIGLLSVDIDGNDYWVWEAINTVNPAIVVAEYNSVFGSEHAITVPYDASFDRTEQHFSNLYFGASLKALHFLAEKKGYALVGCNSNGNNCFFVRKDLLNDKVKAVAVPEAYIESRFRESRDAHGNLTFISGKDRISLIASLKVMDVEKGKEVLIKDLN